MKMPFWPNPQGYRNIEFGLKRVFDLLERLDNPHLKLPPTIHIAGTNGKGSTLSFLQAILEESGIKVHKYTSPHLVNFNERIILAGEEISDDFLNEVLSECKKTAETEPKIPVTFFEGITVAAFLAFSKVDADILLLETGMGGRLDATNVLPKVLSSIITPISIDHEEFLGNTIAKIAAEKAGIIKENCPVIVGRQAEEALKVITKKSEEMKANLIKFDNFDLPNVTLKLSGKHQLDNAKTAIACALSQDKFQITTEDIKNGLAKAFWPARLQKITSGKLYQKLPKNYELYLDGSHNLEGAKTIKEFLEKKIDYKKTVIFSMLNDRNCEVFLKEFSSEINKLIALEIPDEAKSHKIKDIESAANKLDLKTVNARNFEDSFRIAASEESKEKNLILICGSLYLAGKFLELN